MASKKSFPYFLLLLFGQKKKLLTSLPSIVIPETKETLAMQNDFQIIIDKLIEFRNKRDWEQFHNPKDLAIAISAEVGELLELYLWKNAEEADVEKVKEELADILSFSFLLAEKYKFDIKEIILNKIEANNKKYPIDKSKGTAKKYNEL